MLRTLLVWLRNKYLGCGGKPMNFTVRSFASQMPQQVRARRTGDSVIGAFHNGAQGRFNGFVSFFFEGVLAGWRNRSSAHNVLIGEQKEHLNLFFYKVFGVIRRFSFVGEITHES